MSLVSNSVSPDTLQVFGVSFLVLASKVLRPGHVYRLSVTNYSPQTITTHASILRDGVDIASAEQSCSSGVPETIMLRVPPQSLEGAYRLKVEGATETGAIIFSNETNLEFSQRSMTIFVQTDKPIYKQGQVVRFRAVPITTDLKPFSDALDVYILDSNQLIVKRWMSRQTNLGSVSIEYPLSTTPVFGQWTIRVVAQGQVQDNHFLVEEYHPHLFEVNVTLAPSFWETDRQIRGVVTANFTNGAPVIGNITLVMEVELNGKRDSKTTYDETFEGRTDFRIEMSYIRSLLTTTSDSIDGAKITVTAYVGERYLNMEQSGSSYTYVRAQRIRLRFVSSSASVLKPTMPYQTYLAVSYSDGTALPSSKLANLVDKLQINLFAHTRSFGPQVLINRTCELVALQTPGTWSLSIDTRPILDKRLIDSLEYLRIEAALIDYNIFNSKISSASTRVYTYSSASSRALQITTSTPSARVGEYVVFHARSNYQLDLLSYVIMSKGLILSIGRERMRSSITTFAVPVSAEMAPSSTIIVYDIARAQELVADSLTFHVDGTALHNFTIALNTKKDKLGETIEIGVYGQPGTYVGLTAINKDLTVLSTSGQISVVDFQLQLQNFDRSSDTLSHTWLTTDGRIHDMVNFPSPSNGIDVASVLANSGAIVFTDALVPRRFGGPVCAVGMQACMTTERCYNVTIQRCNGRDDCLDNSDEVGCDSYSASGKNIGTGLVPKIPPNYSLYRSNRLYRVYEDNWLWRDVNIGPLGHYIFTLPLPQIPAQWAITAFSMSNQHGFSIQRPLDLSSIRPFGLNLEMPTVCRRGEQIGVRVLLSNYQPDEIEVRLVLGASPDYKFVQVGEGGQVSSFAPETTFGDQEHLMKVGNGSTAVAYMPIVAQRLGIVNVTVTAITQVSRKTIVRPLLVEADGLPQYLHTAVIFDLSKSAFAIKFLDTNITESPVVKYHQERRYIHDSNRARVSVAGDVVGPMFATMPVNTSSLLRLPSDGGEQNVFNFAVNLYSLSWLRLTNQETVEVRKEAFMHLNQMYQSVLRYRNRDGSFQAFRSSASIPPSVSSGITVTTTSLPPNHPASEYQPNVWLTAFTVRTLHMATSQEWENHIFIDPEVIDTALAWLLTKQNNDGSFVEQTPFAYDRKLDYNIHPFSNYGTVTNDPFSNPSLNPLNQATILYDNYALGDMRAKNVSLTAHVLIALHEIKDRGGELGARATNARLAAQKYIESMLHKTTIKTQHDPFDLALCTYALTLVGSIESDEAYNQLDGKMREHSGMRFWSVEPPQTGPSGSLGLNPGIVTQNNRQLIYPRSRSNYDSRSVQTTAYALLTHVLRQAPIQSDIVNWLNSQRLGDGAWSSTQDTVVALQALLAYSLPDRDNIREITDIRFTIETPSLALYNKKMREAFPPNGAYDNDTDSEIKFIISDTNLSLSQSLELPHAHGLVIAKAEGKGIALVQLDVQYNVDWAHLQVSPPVASFELDVRPSYSGRNSSQLHMHVCQRWTLTSESPRSGLTVLEVPVPTGYMINQNHLDRYVAYASTTTGFNANAAVNGPLATGSLSPWSLGSASSGVHNLRDARFTDRRVYFYFDYLDTRPTCVSFTMMRWFPVANMTRYLGVRVYDYYAPERFNETMLDVYNLHALSICHVCGSYQCPYCPIFSSASTTLPSLLVYCLMSLAVTIYSVSMLNMNVPMLCLMSTYLRTHKNQLTTIT